MKFVQRIWMLVVLAVLSGCSATGAKFSDAQAGIPSLGKGQGRIYFYREDSIVGAVIQPEIRLNQEVVGRSAPGGFFFVDRPSGFYDISTTTEVENKISVPLAAGDTKYVRTSISMGLFVGRVRPELVSTEQGRKEIVSMAYTGSVPVLGSSSAPSSKKSEGDKVQATSPESSAPAGTADGDEKLVIQTVEFRPGISSSSVERLAKRFGCEGSKGAGLITEKGPVEVYRVRCDNGTTFMAQCELRQCRPMR
jgi:hypothetical protein